MVLANIIVRDLLTVAVVGLLFLGRGRARGSLNFFGGKAFYGLSSYIVDGIIVILF